MLARVLDYRLLFLVVLLSLPGCSYLYSVHLEGQLLIGPNQNPIQGAKVTLFEGKQDIKNVVTDAQGCWRMDSHLSPGDFGDPKDGRQKYQPRGVTVMQLRIEFDGRQVVIPFPTVYAVKGSTDIQASILTILDAEAN